MSNETYTDALEVPAGTLLANYVAKFVGTLIAFLILTAIWGEHLAMSFDAIWRFDTSGLGAVWVIFVWAGLFALIGKGSAYFENKSTLVGRAV